MVRHDNPLIQPRTVTIGRGEYDALRAFVEKMWFELDDAADAIGPVPDLVERNLRLWHHEAEALLQASSWKGSPQGAAEAGYDRP